MADGSLEFQMTLANSQNNGTLLPYLYGGPGTSGYMDDTTNRYVTAFATSQIIDMAEVESVLFAKSYPEVNLGLTEDNFYEIPVK